MPDEIPQPLLKWTTEAESVNSISFCADEEELVISTPGL